MSEQNKVSGVVLAGGLARRMQQQDKGLVLYRQQPLVSYAIAALAPLVNELWINANRNQQRYREFGYPVIADNDGSYAGPLAGIYAAMQVVAHPVLLVAPCDSPLLETRHLQRLLAELDNAADAELAVAYDGERLHPVFMALNTSLQTSLREYLQSGERKLQTWIARHQAIQVDFSDEAEVFANINSLKDLAELENSRITPFEP